MCLEFVLAGFYLPVDANLEKIAVGFSYNSWSTSEQHSSAVLSDGPSSAAALLGHLNGYSSSSSKRKLLLISSYSFYV